MMKLLVGFSFFITMITYSQTNISGVINDYVEVTSVNMSTNSVDVPSIVNFAVGDKVLIIQMQGATIDESQNSMFGSIIDYGNSGNYEYLTICNISSNSVYFENSFLNTYDVIGNVQLVTVPTYVDALITGSDLTADTWNGTTGGVLVFDVEGTLDFGTQNINVDGKGFAGGQAVPSGNACVFLLDDSYFTNLSSVDETALKGEGIAVQTPTKECGRGPQANGGGGGNNHNGGGSGGANYGSGGAGGQRVKSTNFACGSVVGVDSKSLSSAYTNQKIFLGGGGGAGHGNNTGIIGESGLSGGAIVLITANTIVGNGGSIHANGISSTVNTEGEGGGGAGAGGTVFLDVLTVSSTLNINVNGGDGTSVDNIGTSNCNGPGGGGGGGLIWVSNSTISPNIVSSVIGGSSGVIASTSQPNCSVGSTNGGQNGANGAILTNLVLNSSTTHFTSSLLAVSTCDSYTSPSGNYVWTTSNVYNDTLVGAGINGCDSIIVVDLTINSVDTSVTNLGGILSANTSGKVYQWVDCNDSFSHIDGATNQSFTPIINGDYAVVITTTNCSDTSFCNTIEGLGVLENSFKSDVDIYPNPTVGNVSIDLNKSYRNMIVTVRSVDGKIVSTHTFKNKSKLDVFIEGPAAYYLIEVKTKSGYTATIKILKL